ncbi:MAG: RNA polymerase factor sigma-54 [Lysobacter sp.]|nr:MAG: RNA polymerase factor sigma-54 [Lysobacter sp.]
MKPRLQTSLGQQLVLTPQLRQALHLLQLSSLELDAEIATAVETNPLLDWAESHPEFDAGGDAAPSDGPGETGPNDAPPTADAAGDAHDGERHSDRDEERWEFGESWGGGGSGGDFDDDGGYDPMDRLVDQESLHDHLSWQLHLTRLSPQDQRIGAALIDAIDDDGYLRESLDEIARMLRPELQVAVGDVAAMLSRIQRFDPVGIGARDLRECLLLQIDALSDDTDGKAIARRIVADHLERLPKIGPEGLAAELNAPEDEVAQGLHLVRSLDPRPGSQLGGMSADTYVTPDCVIWRHQGMWRVSLAGSQQRLTIHRGYEAMIQHANGNDASYLRGRLQEARWLLKHLEARGDTLLKVVRCLVRQQSGFLEFGAQALRPLTLREVAAEVGLHESTVSRAVARKYALTPRGTLPLRGFFASGINTDTGGEASSTAIQSMIKRLIDAENPRKPLSDAKLADQLKADGVPVARRTVAKYREAMNIPASHERVRIG